MVHEDLGQAASEAWHRNYGADPEIARRRAAMPAKLARLGLDGSEREAAILDLCCGYGECLDALYSLGYRKLTGVDLTIDPRVAADARFVSRSADARATGLPSASFDWVLNIHAMHHLGGPADLRRFRDEIFRVLKPGGRVGIIDFDDRLSIRAAFWFFRHYHLGFPRYFHYFSELIRSEWPFLKDYLPQWRETRKIWLEEGGFKLVRRTSGLFYFHWVLEKPKGDR